MGRSHIRGCGGLRYTTAPVVHPVPPRFLPRRAGAGDALLPSSCGVLVIYTPPMRSLVWAHRAFVRLRRPLEAYAVCGRLARIPDRRRSPFRLIACSEAVKTLCIRGRHDFCLGGSTPMMLRGGFSPRRSQYHRLYARVKAGRWPPVE